MHLAPHESDSEDSTSVKTKAVVKVATSGRAVKCAKQSRQLVEMKVVEPQPGARLKAKVVVKKESGTDLTPSRSLTAIPEAYRASWSHTLVPVFKAWLGELRIPWYIEKDDLDVIMPALWNHATEGDWDEIPEVTAESAKRIVCIAVLQASEHILTIFN
jgi:hypothetical protein